MSKSKRAGGPPAGFTRANVSAAPASVVAVMKPQSCRRCSRCHSHRHRAWVNKTGRGNTPPGAARLLSSSSWDSDSLEAAGAVAEGIDVDTDPVEHRHVQ